MRTTSILTASAIALAAGVGSAAADVITGSSGGFTAFQTLSGVQAMPLDTDEMASVTGMDWYAVSAKTGLYKEIKQGKNIWLLDEYDHGIKLYGHGYGATWHYTSVSGGAHEYLGYTCVNIVCN